MADPVIPQTFDPQTGAPVNLPEDQFVPAFTSGKVALQKGHDVPMINPQGEPGLVPAEYAHQALQNGFQFDLPSQQLERIKTDEYSGFVPGAEAALAGAARGVTLGLSDQLATKTGMVSPGTLADLQKYRPGWSMAGEAGGILASSIAAPEAGIPGLLSKIGGVASTAVKGVELGRLAKEGTLAAKVLGGAGDIAAHAAGSAVEGALYSGLGNTITEQALGDPDLNGEKIASHFGYGALLGGAIGGALKGVELGVPASIKGAKDAITSVRNILVGSGEGDAGVLGKLIQKDMPEISEAIANRSVNLGKDEQSDLIRKTTAQLNDLHSNNETSIRTLNKDLRPKEVSALIDTADPTLVRNARQDLVNGFNDAVAVMKDEPAIYSKSIARESEMLRDTVVGRMGRDLSPAKIFDSMKEIKQKLNDIVYSSKIPTREELKAISILRPVLASLDETLKNPDIFGFVGSAMAEHDSMLSKYYKFVNPIGKQTPFTRAFMTKGTRGFEFDPVKVERVFRSGDKIAGKEKLRLLDEYFNMAKSLPEHLENTYANVPNETFDPSHLSSIIEASKNDASSAAKKYLANINNSKRSLGLGDYFAAHVAMSHPVIGAAVGAYNIVTKPIQHINQLAEIERLVGKVTQKIASGAKAIFDPAIKATEKIRSPLIGVGAYRDKDEHKEFSNKLMAMNSDPNQMVDKVANSTEAIHGVAPNISESIQQSAIRGSQFLASKLPSHPDNNPLQAPYEPSASEISNFERYRSIVEDPLLTFNQIKTNSIIPETIETLATVYPKLYDQMKQQVLTAATDAMAKKTPISFSTKQQLSFFLGQPVDTALSPQSIQMNQAAFVPPPQPQQQAKPSKTGMQKMTLADRTSPQRRPGA